MRDSSPLIVDCHLDLAWNALGYKRDLTLPLAELNRGEQGLADHAGRGLATTTLPEMRAGGVGLCLATLIARTPVGATAIHGNLLDYPTPARGRRGGCRPARLVPRAGRGRRGGSARLRRRGARPRRALAGRQRAPRGDRAGDGGQRSDHLTRSRAALACCRPARSQPGALRAGALRRRHRHRRRGDPGGAGAAGRVRGGRV